MAFDYTNYYELEYIESNGNQYIQTNINSNTLGRVVSSCKWKNTNRQCLLGCWQGRWEYSYLLYINDNKITLDYEPKESSALSSSFNADTNNYHTYDIDFISNVYKYDDSALFTLSSEFPTANRDVWIFCSNDSGDGAYIKASAYLKYLEIYNKSGVLAYNFIPARRKSDGVVGLYETVSETFYTNSGSGSFTGGPLVTPKFDNDYYYPLEYLETDGTAFINTGYKYNSHNLKFDIDLSIPSLPSGYRTILGMYTSSSKGSPFTIWTQGGNNYLFNDVLNIHYPYNFDGTRQNFVFESQSVSGSSYDLYLFKAYAQSGNVYGGISGTKIYTCSFYDNGDFVCNFVPARRKSDGVLGMYDTRLGVFLTNAGSGSFTGGKRVSQDFDYGTYYELNYLQSSGTQYIDSGFGDDNGVKYDFKVEFPSLSSSTSIVFGTTSSSYRQYLGFTTSSTILGLGTGSVSPSHSYQSNVPYVCSGSFKKGQISVVVNNESVYSATTSPSYSDSHTLYIFATYNHNQSTVTNKSTEKLYYLNLYDTNGVLERGLIPAERKSDGVLGLYDVVYGNFYTNAGSGTFIPGGRIIPFVITTNVSPADSGTVTGGGEYPSGASVVLTATANVGYAFSQWDDGNTDNPRTITVTGDATYTAQFVVPQLRTITLNTTPAGAGTVSGGGQYYDGTVITISATANDGFAFDEWSDGDTNNPRTLTVNSDLTLTAIFKITGVLPKRYIPMTSLGGTNVYFDTGVYPTNDMNIECAFYVDESYDSYLFGARNSNSNTSAGQLNGLCASTSYLGFASTRYSLGSYNSYGYMFLTNEDNEFLMNYRGDYLKEVTGATTTFTGTQPMYILAMNNGGSVNYGSNPFCFVARFAISQGGTKIKDYYPVYDTQTSQFGLYDFVNDAFLSPSGSGSFQTTHLMEIRSSVGGNAYMEMPFGEVQKIYMTPTRYYNGKTFVWKLYSPIKAVADEGYGFLNWTDQDGNVYSTEEEIVGNAEFTQDMVITANFVKKTDVLQTNPFQLMGIRYGIPARIAHEDVRKDDFYTFIESFSINEDSLNKTTSTIVCRTIPSIYQTNMPVVVYDNFGKMVWAGMIESIDGNTLTCREPLATYDEEFMFTQTSSFVYNGYPLSTFTVLEALYLYFMRSNMLPTSDWDLATNNYNSLTSRKRLAVTTTILSEANLISYDKTGNIFTTLPEISERSIGNMEEYLFEIINQFGIGYKTNVLLTDYSHTISVTLTNPLLYKTLVLGDNNDFISNIQVTSEMQEDNVLIIFNEAGTSVRGQYGMRTDGTVKKVPGALADADNPNFIGWQNCKAKVVMSDDNINTLIAQYLTNSMYNHKITFDIELNNKMVRLGDFKMGRRVEFHIGDKLYHSIVTGRSYSLAENEKEIRRATITLGNVRTSLTSKLNLGKVK